MMQTRHKTYEGTAKSAAFEVTELTNRASETFVTTLEGSISGTDPYTYTNDNTCVAVSKLFTNKGFMVNNAGYFYGDNSSMYGATIEKIVMVRGYYQGVLIKRGLEDGVKLTRKLASQDKVLSDANATFRVADKGEGVTLRPYIEIDGVRKYGTQVTFKLSEMIAVS